MCFVRSTKYGCAASYDLKDARVFQQERFICSGFNPNQSTDISDALATGTKDKGFHSSPKSKTK